MYIVYLAEHKQLNYSRKYCVSDFRAHVSCFLAKSAVETGQFSHAGEQRFKNSNNSPLRAKLLSGFLRTWSGYSECVASQWASFQRAPSRCLLHQLYYKERGCCRNLSLTSYSLPTSVHAEQAPAAGWCTKPPFRLDGALRISKCKHISSCTSCKKIM